ncbi:hypothetical protein [Actinokineospora enzanensis]|uniref:hypothetical protein n=1 Tax=Actinokineospora enzanensis TaxID=155975 RepID=UPI0003719D67|nr:hypothetical protein [Actinokineospora enzanensis]
MSLALRKVAQPSIAVSALAVIGLLCASTPVVAAPERDGAVAVARWLARQVDADGTVRNPLGGALPDHGLMIDLVYASYAAGAGELAQPILRYLDDQRHAGEYFAFGALYQNPKYDAVIDGGYAAKTLVAAEVAGRDPRHFGGWDLLAETKGSIPRSGPDKGRVSVHTKNPELADAVDNNTNTFGQSLAVIGLAGVREVDQLAVDRLVGQQCVEGYFRILYSFVPTTETGDDVLPGGYKLSSCEEGKPYDLSEPDNDATAMGLSALLAARAAGARGVDGPIDGAVRFLRGAQDASGGWGGGVTTEAPNTNSTGLVVQALADAGGSDAQVRTGLAYLKAAQVNQADAGTRLAEDIGAIAYDPQQYRDSRQTGMSSKDTWVRAGAQAALGLAQVGFHDLTQGKVPPTDTPTSPEPTTTTTTTTTTTGPATGLPPAPQTIVITKDGTTRTITRRVPAPVSRRAGTPAPPPNSAPGVPLAPPTPAQAPEPETPVGHAAAYLAGRLVDGDHVEVTQDGRTFVDYDATADVVLALHALGGQPDAVDRATRFLLTPASIDAYAHGVPYEPGPAAYAEPLARLRLVAGFQRDTGEYDQVSTDLDAALAGLRSDAGIFTDTGQFADASTAVQRHVWATTATIAASDHAALAAVDSLADRQCRDGTFPQNMTTADCATGDLAATASAVIALDAARASTQPTDPSPTGPSPTEPLPGNQSASVEIPANRAPAEWSTKRTTALVAAAAALNARTATDGTVRGPDGDIDVPMTAAIAGGRQFVGLDIAATTRALADEPRSRSTDIAPDNAMGEVARLDQEASDGNVLTDLVTAAPAVAGRSWAGAEHAPVVPAVRLPLTGADSVAAVARSSDRVSPWLGVGLVGLGFLLAVAAVFGTRLVTRNSTPKVVSR